MKTSASRCSLVWGLVAMAGYALAGAGCGAPSRSTSGTGGSGGSNASGAAGSNSTGAAGSNSTGAAGSNSTGAAGSDSSGAAGSNSTGTAGSTGAAGSGITNTLPATFAYLFDTSPQGWLLSNYADPSRTNLGAATTGTAPTLAWDATAGDPAAGSLKATASFTGWKQYVDPIINLAPAKNIPGHVLRVRVRLVSGSFTGGAQLHAGTGATYKYASSTWTTLPAGQWVELGLDLDAAHAADSAFDPTMVVQVGVKFDTGGDGGTAAFGATVDAVFQIDTFSDGVVGGALPSAVNYTFDADKQGFGLNDYANPGRTNLGASGSAAPPVLSWDGAAGSPTTGALKLEASFSDFKQYADVVLNLSSVDLTGKTLHAWVKLSGGAFTGGATLHAGTGPSYDFTGGTWTTLSIGDWLEMTLDLSAVTGAGDVRQLGIQFDTGDAEDGGTFGSAVATTVHIDSFTVTP